MSVAVAAAAAGGDEVVAVIGGFRRVLQSVPPTDADRGAHSSHRLCFQRAVFGVILVGGRSVDTGQGHGVCAWRRQF